MEKNEILIKFIKTNTNMIKHIWNCDYLSDSQKLKKISFFHFMNIRLFHDLYPHN